MSIQAKPQFHKANGRNQKILRDDIQTHIYKKFHQEKMNISNRLSGK